MRMTIFITDGVNIGKHFIFSVFYTVRNRHFFLSGQFFSAFQKPLLFFSCALSIPSADTKVKIFYLKVSTSLFAFFTLLIYNKDSKNESLQKEKNHENY